eukprot:COSAG02_NODE_78_length_40609_cov_19.893730_10_plen_315_part_00
MFKWHVIQFNCGERLCDCVFVDFQVREGWYEHRKILPMPRPTRGGQDFRAVSLTCVAERSWMEFMLFQPSGREGGELYDRSIGLGAYADLCLTLIHTPDPTPQGARGWELVAGGRRGNSSAVSLETPGVRGGTSHLLLPLGGFCRACDPSICDRLAAALVLYSSSAVQATTVSLSPAEVARCLLLRAKGGGERTKSTKIRGSEGPGLDIILHTLKDNVLLAVVENQHHIRTARVEYDCGGNNLTCSRGDRQTVDTIAPRHFQVIRIDSELDHTKGWHMRSSFTTQSYVHEDRGEPAHHHQPAIEHNAVHYEFPL